MKHAHFPNRVAALAFIVLLALVLVFLMALGAEAGDSGGPLSIRAQVANNSYGKLFCPDPAVWVREDGFGPQGEPGTYAECILAEIITPTATSTVVPPTVTIEPTLTPTPTMTPTATTPPPTATAPPPGHNLSMWHTPGANGVTHHHGADPMSAHPEIVAFLQANPLFLQIGHPWLSSPLENEYPYPGKHEGFANLVESDTNCDQFNPGGNFPHGNCIKAYYIQVHTMGTAEAFRTRVHSYKLVALVCDVATQTQCDVVALGGHSDYGERHSEYKRTVCNLPNNPPLPPEYSGDQPPYVTINGRSLRQHMFWSSLTNTIVLPYYEPDPNRIAEIAWNERPWEVPSADPNLCADPAFDSAFCPDGSCDNNKTKFQVFTIVLDLDEYPRPYDGFLDVFGNDAPGCTAPSDVCIPLHIGAGVPEGHATLNRVVDHGDPADAPILDYDNGATLLMPGYAP